MNNNFEKFIENIAKTEKNLDLLYFDSENLIDDLKNKIININFDEKDKILTKYENLLINVTHEIVGEIGFFRQSIVGINNFLHFRVKYNNFSDEALGKIIDNELTIIEKKELFKENSAKEIVNEIKKIKQEWKKIFKYASYKRVKENQRLDEL